MLSFALPVIWNKSEATYYSLGSRRTPQGSAVSYGLNAAYTTTLYKSFFITGGLGYFRQSFGIERPFDFTAPDSTKPLVYTKKYSYSTMQLFAGIGYRRQLNKRHTVKAAATYNWFYTFRQKYRPANFFTDYSQPGRQSFAAGSSVNVQLGMEQKLTEKISLGIDLLLPLSVSWNDDTIFFRYGFAHDTQQIGRNKASAGIALLCNYHF